MTTTHDCGGELLTIWIFKNYRVAVLGETVLSQNHFFNVWKSLHLCGFVDNNRSLRSEEVKYPLIVSCFLVGFLLSKKALDCRQRHIYSHSFVIGKTVPILCKFIATIQVPAKEHHVSMGNIFKIQVSLTESKIDTCKTAKSSVIWTKPRS